MNSQMTSQIGGIIHSQSTIGALKCSGEQSMRPNIKVMRAKIVTYSHCTFSSNLFHEQITQISIHQLSDTENKKCSP